MKKLLAGLLAIIFALSLAACDGEAPSKNNPTTSAPSASQPSSDTSTPDTTPEPEPSTSDGTISQSINQEKAKEIAFAHAKLTEADISHLEIEVDRNDKGVVLYEIEFNAGNDHYDYDISVRDGTILNAEKNDKNILETTYKKIDEAKAKEIALAHAKLAAADISRYKIEFDVDDGIPSYEIEFFAGGYEYEYDINAADGTIIKSEKEIVD